MTACSQLPHVSNVSVLVSMETKRGVEDPEALSVAARFVICAASHRHLPLIAFHSQLLGKGTTS